MSDGFRLLLIDNGIFAFNCLSFIQCLVSTLEYRHDRIIWLCIGNTYAHSETAAVGECLSCLDSLPDTLSNDIGVIRSDPCSAA